MCKKEYEQRMNEFLKSVSFRIEFFSLPTFKDPYLDHLTKVCPGYHFKERPLSQSEWQIIDLDTIAMDLDVPIVNIAEDKNFVFDNIIVGGLKSTVFVSPYYIFVHIPIEQGNSIGETLESDLNLIFDSELLQKTQIQKKSCIVYHYLNITPSDLFNRKVLDKDAFPQIYPDEIYTGRYSDSHQTENGIEQTLVRDIERGQDIDTKAIYLSVSITSISTIDNSITESYQQMYNLALKEAARCFK